MKSALTTIAIIWAIMVVVFAIITFIAYRIGVFDRKVTNKSEREELLEMYEDYKDEIAHNINLEDYSVKELFYEIIWRIRNR